MLIFWTRVNICAMYYDMHGRKKQINNKNGKMLESTVSCVVLLEGKAEFVLQRKENPISNVAIAQYVTEIDQLGIKFSTRGRNHLGWSFSICCVNISCKQNFTAHKRNSGVYMWGERISESYCVTGCEIWRSKSQVSSSEGPVFISLFLNPKKRPDALLNLFVLRTQRAQEPRFKQVLWPLESVKLRYGLLVINMKNYILFNHLRV